ncbi:hypothetical protein ACFW1A_22950, partial [Kitasatospora sp. NPDC058965]
MSQTPDPAGDTAAGEPAVPEPRTSRSADLAALTEAIRAVERRTGPAPAPATAAPAAPQPAADAPPAPA